MQQHRASTFPESVTSGARRSCSDFGLVGAGSPLRLCSPQRSSFSVFQRHGDFSYFCQPPWARQDFCKPHFTSALHSACSGCLTSEPKLARRIPWNRRSSVERTVPKHCRLSPIRFLSGLLLRLPAISPLDPSLCHARCLFVRFQLVAKNAQFLESSSRAHAPFTPLAFPPVAKIAFRGRAI